MTLLDGDVERFSLELGTVLVALDVDRHRGAGLAVTSGSTKVIRSHVHLQQPGHGRIIEGHYVGKFLGLKLTRHILD